MILRREKAMDSISCLMMGRISKNVSEELCNAIEVNQIMKKLDKMHSIALWKKKMLPKVGILNFIVFIIKFISIGMVLRNKLKL